MHVSQVLNRYLLHALTLLELLIPHSFDRCLTISECILTLIIWEFFRHYFLIHSNLDIHIFLAISMLCIPKHVLPKYGIYSLKNSVFSLPFNPSKFGYTCIFGYTNVMYPEKRSTKVRYIFSEKLCIFTPIQSIQIWIYMYFWLYQCYVSRKTFYQSTVYILWSTPYFYSH